MQISFDNAKWMSDGDGTWLMLKVKDIRTVQSACNKISEEKANNATLERKYEKRSNDANRYCWTLLEKLAKELNMPKEDIYRDQVRDVPQKPLKVLIKASEVDDEIKLWQKNGLGWYADIVGESTEHKGFVWIDKFKGSSQFDRKQMAVLIDNVIYECQELGIETRTPDEIAKMISLWGEKNG
jgi:hypothetical protein